MMLQGHQGRADGGAVVRVQQPDELLARFRSRDGDGIDCYLICQPTRQQSSRIGIFRNARQIPNGKTAAIAVWSASAIPATAQVDSNLLPT
jgi:hypothetical protein